MNKVQDNKLSTVKTFFFKELKEVLGARECKSYFELCCESWLGMSKSDLILDANASLSESELLKFLYGIKAFNKHVPLAHVLGEQWFYGLLFKVNEHVLIPRPETEELVDLIIKENQGVKNILDLGTGSGCIAVSLKKHMVDAKISAIDISKESLDIASFNSFKNNTIVNFINHDALDLESLFWGKKKWDVIVSNPPYIPIQEKSEMDKNVTDFDPALALFVPNDDPLLFYNAISQWAVKSLSPAGKLYFEIHENYGKDVCSLLSKIGFSEVFLIQDLQGKDRIVKAII
ncbi:MAG: release factor glutamine methyltransferase [Saprospiraceae bacterium]|jgi:release factor glutamine methyltransferase